MLNRFVLLVTAVLLLMVPQLSEAATVNIADAADPVSFSAEVGTTGNTVDNFDTAKSGGGGSTIATISVTTTGTANIAQVSIKSLDGLTTYGSSAIPAGNIWTVTVSPAPAVPGNFRVDVDLNAGATPGQTVTAYVSDFTVSGGATKGAAADAAGTTLTITAPALANQIVGCSDCHTYGPTDGVRSAATGAVVGSHTAHSAYDCSTCHVIPTGTVEPPVEGAGATGYDHRSGTIQMAASIQGGFYDKNGNTLNDDGPFSQTDSPVLASCENVACHNSTTTPAWGGSVACDSCHGLPPATNAHLTHYTARGWTTGVTTNCIVCHPDNEAVSHSSVTDATVEVVLGHSGAGTATTCSTWTTGCHNDSATTPTWGSTGITCQSCHTVGGANSATVANPASGLHDEVPVTTGVIHNPTNPNFSGCEDCHTANPSASHWSGTVETPSTFAASLNYAAGSPATCAATCHSDFVQAGESWDRKWHENSDQTNGTECAGCHGDWANGWNTGVTHRGIVGTDTQPQAIHGSSGTNYQCKDCHALEAASGYTWATQHKNNKITINSNGTGFARGTGGNAGKSGCTNACHSNGFDGVAEGLHSFTTTGWPTVELVSGDSINAGCDSCHGNGAGQYWPDGAAYPDRAGRHDLHITRLATQLGITLPGTDAQQKTMCGYCHNDPSGVGGSGHFESPTWTEPANVGGFDKIWDGTADATSSYTAATQTCAIACHNGKTTTAGTFGWRDAGTSTCTLCHTAGGGVANEILNPTSGLHALTATGTTAHDDSFGSGYSCTNCHQATPSAAHINGTGNNPGTTTFNWNSGSMTLAIGTLSNNADDTCTSSCHSDGNRWSRKWSTAANVNHTTMTLGQPVCAVCHGTFDTGFVSGMGARHQTTTTGDADGDIQASHGSPDHCYQCHNYKAGDTTYYDFTVKHRDGKIQINSNDTFKDNGATVGCSQCHADNDGTADEQHEFIDTTATAAAWTRSLEAGPTPSCTSCHNGSGGGGKNVSASSPHAQGNANFNFAGTGVTGCESCHFTSHASQATGTINIANNVAMGINYSKDGSGIYIKKFLGTETSEAQVCWNCHEAATAQAAPFEFNGTGAWYKEGTLNQSDWTSASWTSSTFAYKAGLAIHSTHEVGEYAGVDANLDGKYDTPVPAANMANTDKAANASGLKCTLCHDVHGIMGFPRQNASQTYSGGLVNVSWSADTKVFLRGPWYGSPYREDGAPNTSATNNTAGFTFPANNSLKVDGGGTGASTWGTNSTWNTHMVGPNHVVRVQSLATVTGSDWPALTWGTHIDDNVYGTNGGYGYDPGSKVDMTGPGTLGTVTHIDYSATTNLCMKCHGTLSNLVTLWSGHNAVRGGTAAATNDIFSPKNGINQHYMYTEAELNWAQSANNVGYAGELANDGGWGSGSLYNWSVNLKGQTQGGVTVDTSAQAQGVGGGGATTVNAGTAAKEKFHQFTCSKCHSPHASANARLMITNCMNRDGTGASTFNIRESGPGRIVGTQAASDVANILGATYPEPQNSSRDIADPWIATFGGHERAVHCHNNAEQHTNNYWQEIP